MAEDGSNGSISETWSTAQEKQLRLAFTNRLLFETPGGTRYTLDSPILPNVWMAFALKPQSQQELILTTTDQSNAGETANELRRMLVELRKQRPEVGGHLRERARVAYIPGQIAAKLYFDEMMRVVLPLTPWWHETYDSLKRCFHRYKLYKGRKISAYWEPFPRPDPVGLREEHLFEALMMMRREIAPMTSDLDLPAPDPDFYNYIREMPPSLAWLVRVAGVIAEGFEKGLENLSSADPLSSRLKREFEARRAEEPLTSTELERQRKEFDIDYEHVATTRRRLVAAFVKLYEAWPDIHQPHLLDEIENPDKSKKIKYPTKGVIWRVTKNRTVQLAVAKSALTVKADAARKLFSISCRGITWAVLDSGIDRDHPAFRGTTEEHELAVRRAQAINEGSDQEYSENLPLDELKSRIVQTLDFTFLRELLDIDLEYVPDDASGKERKERLLNKIACRMTKSDCPCSFGQKCRSASGESLEKAEAVLEKVKAGIQAGREINWADLQDAIVAKEPPTPINDHGTHVAGILGADWIDEDIEEEENMPLAKRTRRMTGICPDINLIDVRVFREDGLTDEFELLAALQYLRWMNSRAGMVQVHGANLSLSLIHEVRRFACGQTPICDECNEAAALGMVIVAAAGNRGFDMSDLEEVRATDSYKAVSITDPGNAEGVITVGATHRKRPHEYGVSYFSSRGPTGDGRLKPDLVAPGEKIKGPTPNGRAEFKDGTSMAAPHVSGVAALLMARHSELIGQPRRIKKILCDTATDLGRERYFQGHGLVDALRAIQSV